MKRITSFICDMIICFSLGLAGASIYSVCQSFNDTIFIQIWMKRAEVNELKKCKPGTHVRVERPNDEYYILPCTAVRNIQ
jgi:hypothetical protein